MIPVREVRDPSIPRRAPLASGALIVANLFAFLFVSSIVEGGDRGFVFRWGLVPYVVTQSDPLHGALTVLTSMFMHGGWVHLLGNMLFLWVFGQAVEEALGRPRFLALYLLGGVAAAGAQIAVDPSSTVPMLGASGAIGAVLGAYVSIHPFRRIETFIPPFFVWPLPAIVLVGEWFVLNLLRGVGSLEVGQTGGVAWWAHVGGFLSGLLLVRLFFPKPPAAPDHRHAVVVRDRTGRRFLVS